MPRANRTAKPISAGVSFGCSKFFLSVDTEERVFKCGLQVERGYVKAPHEHRYCQLRADWDWHRLIKELQPRSLLERELETNSQARELLEQLRSEMRVRTAHLVRRDVTGAFGY